MFFQWLKRYLPRGLYGRAALILILPVVTLQLVVSVVFIQRNFNGVTQQMTWAAAREVRLVLAAQDMGGQAAMDALAVPLEMTVQALDGPPPDDMTRWFDLSGRIVIAELKAQMPDLVAVRLPDDRVARLYLAGDHGTVLIALDRRRLSASNPHQLFVNMAFFGVLMTLISFIYLRNQLRPITRLAKTAEAFGKGRNIPYRPTGAIEVRAAGHAFLDMRARIERHIEQRTLMLSGVSHDLRTPLTRLKLGLAMLEDEEREPMERDVAEMQEMLDEFLAFTRGAAEGEAEPTDAIALIQQVVADAQRAGRAVKLVQMEGQEQREDGADNTARLRPQAIKRALNNLIGNAVRYGDHAEVSVVMTEKSLRIRVEDDGPGIPPEARGQAVKPFTRLDAARNQNRGSGVGLGLAIATDIAHAHGGVLRLGESARMGGLRAEIVIAR
ncbi:MAG: ATP-binding protein [Paracoccaceae bacterium]